MSKVKALDELREIAADINASEIVDHMKLYPSCVFDGAWLDAWHDEFYRAVDRLESEIAEKYMELPVDAEGVPFKMGDEVVIPKCYEGTVVSIEVGDMDTIIGVDGHDGYLRYGISDVHHVKPRTIEDVLDELADEIIRQGHQAGLTAPGIIAKYADELRGMGVGE